MKILEKLENKFKSFQTALERLREAINIYKKDKHPVLLDGTIQRFEFTVELAWKLLKEYLESEKFGEFNSPKSVVKEAFKIGLLEDGEIWLDMLDDRNLTSHTYDEEIAKEIYRNIITKYEEQFIKLENKIKEVIKDE